MLANTLASEQILKVRVLCIDLPDANWGGAGPIWLGVQEGKNVVQAVQLPAEEVAFELEFRVTDNDGKPNFLGPFAQGTPQERFFYLCWGHFVGMGWAGFRRAKIPLGGLSTEQVSGGKISATIRCTDAKGGPACATLKGDFVQWTVP